MGDENTNPAAVLAWDAAGGQVLHFIGAPEFLPALRRGR
jgi:hypothetical protein